MMRLLPCLLPLLAALAWVESSHAQSAEVDPETPPRYVLGLSMSYGPEYWGAARSGSSMGLIGAAQWGAWRLSTGGGTGLLLFGQDEADRGAGASREIFRNAHWRVGVGLRIDGGRKSDSVQSTRGLPDVQRTVRARLYATYQPNRRWTLLAALHPDMLGHGGGITASLELDHQVLTFEYAELRLGVAAHHGSARYMRSYFGVPASALGNQHAQVYSPGGGWRDAGLHLHYTHSLGRHWVGFATVGWGQLLGPARHSPLAVRDAAWSGGAGVAYRF